MLTSITPGSGVSLKWLQPVVVRRRVALDQHRQVSARRPCPRRRRPGRGNLPGSRCGGMKTCSRPSRGSTQRAVRTTPRSAGPFRATRRPRRGQPGDGVPLAPLAMASANCGRRAIVGPARGKGPRGAIGSSSMTGSRSSSAVPGQRVERQAKAHRRVAGDQVQVLAAQRPLAAHPAGLAVVARAAAAGRSRRPCPGPARRPGPGARAPRRRPACSCSGSTLTGSCRSRHR